MSSFDRTDLQPFVDRLASHSKLSIEERQVILGLPTRTVQAEANRDFVRLGQKTEHACFIVEGLAGHFGQNADGARQITALHIPGDMIDLHSVVLPNATSALQALTTSTILQVPHSAIRAATKGHSAIAEAFWRECMIDAAILSQWVVNVGRRDARTRIAHLLCEMAVRHGVEIESGGSYSFPVTQNHLAEATGLTPVHVNRTLKILREDGIATLRSRTVEIHDWTRSGKQAISIQVTSVGTL